MDWRGESDDAPRFTRGARRWFAQHIRAAIETEPQATAIYELRPEEIGQVVGWLQERYTEYVSYLPTEEYRGRGWSHGAWVVDRAALKTGWRLALNTIRGDEGEAEASVTDSLDEWLRADIAGTVQGVKGGDAAIPDEQWASLAGAADARRKRLARRGRRARR
jgi:hypothetical protein